MAAAVPSMSIASVSFPSVRCSDRPTASCSFKPLSAPSCSCVDSQPRSLALSRRGRLSVRSAISVSGTLWLGEKLKGRIATPLPRVKGFQVVAIQNDIIRVLGSVLKTGREGLDAGTRLVPETVPRPLAQAGVALVGLLVLSFLLRSLFSTLIFVAAVGGICYGGVLYLTRNGSSSSGGGDSAGANGAARRSDSEAVEEARRIMEKYK